jgi:hypothetical protein
MDASAASELWIDSKTSYPIPASRVGEARWRDGDARDLIKRFENGEMLLLNTRAPGVAQPYQTVVSLLGFEQALAAYRAGLKNYGIGAR